MTAATTVEYSNTGPRNAENLSDLADQDLPEELMFKEAYADTSRVQCCNNIDAFYEYEMGKTNINVKGRLKNSVNFWQKIGTSDFILDMIYEGYTIPLLHEPKSVFLNNNKSANVHTICVENAISELISDGLVREVSSAPHVVNPLTVAVNGKDKVRLILDLRHVNKQVVQCKIKFEAWRTAKQYMQIDSFGFIFDLKSGYHHIDIFPLHQTYLGFAWKFNNIENYFVFTVLPFDLQSSA